MEQFWQKFKWLLVTQPDLVVFGIFIFLFPFNTRKFLNILLPYSDQVFNTWSAFFLYLSDLLLLLVLALWLYRILNHKFRFSGPRLGFIAGLSAFLLIMTVSTIARSGGILSWSGILRTFEFGLLAFYALSVIVTWRRRFMVMALFFSAMSLQAVIGVVQFITQKSVGLSVLGESALSTQIWDVAEVVSQGQIWLRAYGTQVHPNVLAYLLTISLIFGVYLYARVRSISWRMAISALAGLQLMVLVMSFSRTGWLGLIIGLGCLVILCLVWGKSHLTKLGRPLVSLAPLIITAVILLGSLVSLWPLLSDRITVSDSHGDLASSYRIELKNLGWDRFAIHPIIGIAPRQFVPSLSAEDSVASSPWKFQPIHNVYILMLVEIGVLGVVAFSILIGSKIRRLFRIIKNVPRGTFFAHNIDVLYVFIVFSCLLVSLLCMLFDHYIYDIQQSSLMFWLLLGI